MPKISARHALDEREYNFCVKVAAGLNQTEAYRRAFEYVEKDAAKKASALAKQPHIEAYLAELRGEVADMARQSFVDQLVGTEKKIPNTSTLLGAARAILDDEALQAERDDLEKFWMVAAACGAEVVAAVGDQEVVVPLTDLMPKFKDATPPQDALDKTARSLEAWYEKLCEKEEELDERDRQTIG